MSEQNWWNLSIANLRGELRRRGLDTAGAKPQMVQRLQNYEENYKSRVEALKAKQSSATKPLPKKEEKSDAIDELGSDYKVVDEWKSTDEENKEKTSGSSSSEGKSAANGSAKPVNYWGMTMAELRKECEAKSVSTMGSKVDIIDRLKTFDAYQQKKAAAIDSGSRSSSKERSSGSGTESPKPAASSGGVKPLMASPVVQPLMGQTSPRAGPTSGGAKPAASPASVGAKPAASPASVGAKPAASPVSVGAKPDASPASVLVKPAVSPASGGAKPTASPASVWAKPAASPTSGGAKPAASPASVGAKTDEFPVSVGAKPAASPASVAAKPAASPASVGAKPAASPASVWAKPAASPASVGAKPAEFPVSVGAKPAVSPDSVGAKPSASPASVGAKPAQSPASVWAKPAASPASVGAKPTASPASVGAKQAASPASVWAKPAASPASVGAKPTASPASVGAKQAASPASVGAKPAASPASVGSKPAASPASVGAKPVVTPAGAAKPTATPTTGVTTPESSPASADTKSTGATPVAAKSPAAASPVKTASPTGAAAASVPLDVLEKRYYAMTFAQLKIECINRKLNILGSKPDIIRRLIDHEKSKMAAADSSQPNVTPPSPSVTPSTPQAASPAPPKKEMKDKFAQVTAVHATKFVQVELITAEEPKPMPLHHCYATETLPNSFSRRREWTSTSLPDIIQEVIPDMTRDVASKTLVVYPVTFTELLTATLTRWRNHSRECVVRFENEAGLDKAVSASVELRFYTRAQVEQATKELRTWKKEAIVLNVLPTQTIDQVLKNVKARPKNLEPLANRLIFLNKIAANIKDGNVAAKFPEAASVVIARDTDMTSKGYGYVEYLSREDAEKAMNRERPLRINNTTIDMKLFPKLPSLVTDEIIGVVLSDAERTKMAETYHSQLLQRGKDLVAGRNTDVNTKQLEKLGAELDLDAAIRKKLGYTSLPEPAVHQTEEQRRRWSNNDYRHVDLGSVQKIWADRKDAEAASKAYREYQAQQEAAAKKAESEKSAREGPPPAKQTRYDSPDNRRDRSRDRSGDFRRGSAPRDQREELRRKDAYSSRFSPSNQKTGQTPPSLMSSGGRDDNNGRAGVPSLMGSTNTPGVRGLMGAAVDQGNKPGPLGTTGPSAFGRPSSNSGGPPASLVDTYQSIMEADEARAMALASGGRTGSQSDLQAYGRDRPGAGAGSFAGQKRHLDESAPARFGSGDSAFARQPGAAPDDFSKGRDRAGLLDPATSGRPGQPHPSADRSAPYGASSALPGRLHDDPYRQSPQSSARGSPMEPASVGGGYRSGAPEVTAMGRYRGGGAEPATAAEAATGFGRGRDGFAGRGRDDRGAEPLQRGPAGAGAGFGRGRAATNLPPGSGYEQEDVGGFGRGSRGRQMGRGGGRGGADAGFDSFGQRPLLGRKDLPEESRGPGPIGRGRPGAEMSRFGDEQAYSSHDTSFGHFDKEGDQSYVEPMEEDMEFRRTPGAKDPQSRLSGGIGHPGSTGGYNKDPYASKYPADTPPTGSSFSAPGARKTGDPYRDQFGDRELWTEDYTHKPYGGNNKSRKEPAGRATEPATSAPIKTHGRGLADTLSQLLPSFSNPSTAHQPAAAATATAPYGGSVAAGKFEAGRRSRFDQPQTGAGAKPASTAGASDYTSGAGGARGFGSVATGGAASSMGAPHTDQEYYRQGMAAKYGTGYGAGSQPQQQQPALTSLAGTPLEEMSVDLLKELSSKVSALRSKMHSDTSMPGSQQQMSKVDVPKPQAAYSGGAVSYPDSSQTARNPYGAVGVQPGSTYGQAPLAGTAADPYSTYSQGRATGGQGQQQQQHGGAYGQHQSNAPSMPYGQYGRY